MYGRIQLGGERSFPSTSTLSETTGAGSTTSLVNKSNSNGTAHTYIYACIHTYIHPEIVKSDRPTNFNSNPMLLDCLAQSIQIT